MARIRTIKPEMWQDEQFGTLPLEAQMLFIGLISHADDDGRLRGNPLLIKAQVFPYKPDTDIEAALRCLSTAGRIVRYTANGQAFIWIRRFVEHQRIEKPKASTFPAPPAVHDASTMHPGTVVDESAMDPGWKGEEGNGKDLEGKGAADPPPPKVHSIPDIQRPTLPPEAWTGQDFWAWAQDRRRAGGLAVERKRPKDLGAWYSGALMSLNGNVGALQEAFYRFGESAYWQGRDPPLPFAGFASQWDQFLPQGVTRAAS